MSTVPMYDPNRRKEPGRVAMAVGLVAMSLLAYQLVTTRLFSVILWNHFAFLAISIGLFGFGVAGVTVYAYPKFFTAERAARHFRFCTLVLAPALWLSVGIVCALPIRMDMSDTMFRYLVVIFLVSAVPFVLGGVAISLALTHWPRHVNRIYAFDLVGSGLGCIVVIGVLALLDGPTAAMSLAILPIAAALILRPSRPVILMLVLAVAGVALNSSEQWVRVRIARSQVQKPIFEAWNAYSQVIVKENDDWPGWWVSPKTKARIPDTKGIVIDGDAFTPIIRFDGNFDDVAIVLEDLTAVAYHLYPSLDSALVIGAGGGKDVLAALAAGTKHVRAIELNSLIAGDIMGDAFKAYSGNLYEHPRVTLIVGEGRTVVRHDGGHYDVVQLSMVDTSAASASGAYALTENSLYTLEAAVEFLDHLNPGGTFTATWANFPNLQGVNRLVALYAEALRVTGRGAPQNRIAVVAAGSTSIFRMPLGTVLVRPDGFSRADSERLVEVARKRDFALIYVPGVDLPEDPERPERAVIREMLTTDDLRGFYSAYPLDLTPVKDDRPFFFYQNRLRDFGDVFWSWNQGVLYGNGMFILAKLLVISGVAVLVFMGIPLALAPGTALRQLRGHGGFLIYFFCLGLGFITLEIALVQQFGYYLGHPLLGLGVSLATLLVFTGVGSGLGQRWSDEVLPVRLRWVLIGVVVLGLGYALVLPSIRSTTLAMPTLVRVAVAILTVAPLGTLLGLPFPSGLRLLGEESGLTPWMWAINAGSSVFGATLATMVVMHAGFSATLAAGAAVYSVALLAVVTSIGRQRESAQAA